MEDRISIKSLETLDEFRACHGVQKRAWSFPDELVIPYTQLFTIQHNGGLVLGAFDREQLVGFVFGYLGRQGGGSLYLFSQRMGVLPEYQGLGIGERLKWAQRAWALKQGLDRIRWTYDPLESPNARLNVAKLGGVIRHYERDIYGQHDTPLHKGLPTDRFVLEWEILSARVLARCQTSWSPPALDSLLAEAGPPLNSVTWSQQGLPACGPLDLARGQAKLAVEVPSDWQGLRQADMALAVEWRMATRRLFEHYLERGYAVTGYATGQLGKRQRNYYLLEIGA